jgi:hypothetical protein
MDAQPAPSDQVHGLRFLLPEDRERFRDGLPQPSEAEHDPGRTMVMRALQPAANDSLSDLVIVGWAAGALDLVAGDPCLSAKETVWVVSAGQLPHAAAAFVGRDQSHIRFAVCDQADQVPYILSQMALCFSFAALDTRLGEPAAILYQAWNRFVRTILPPERVIGDLQHLLARLDRLERAVPLTAWKDHYRGETALCLAAGPSLNQSLELVRRIQDRCVVIVVDVIQKRVQAAGIKVDFVLNVDTSASLVKLMSPSPDPHTVLVMPLVGHRDLDPLGASVSYFANEAFSDWLLGSGEHTFPKGTTVGIATVGFARYLGCREVLLCGHDLAFKPDAYYSDLVDRGSHEAPMRALSNPSMRLITGNTGEQVPTDMYFQVAVEDLAMLLRSCREQLVAYNHNINLRTGARIDGTIALPEDWEPRRRDPLPRPASATTLRDAGVAERAAGFVDEMRRRAAGAVEFWQNRRKAQPDVFSHLSVPPIGDLHLAMPYLTLFDRGLVYHMLRLLALPPSITVAGHHDEMEEFTARVMDESLRLLDRVLTGEPHPLRRDPPELFDTGLTQAQFSALFGRIALDDEFSMDAAMMPAVATNYLNLRLALPHLGLPAPHSANEGLRLCQNLGLKIPRRFLLQTLCLCVLEDERWYGPCLTWAREQGVIGADTLTSRAVPHDDGEEPWLSASEAVLRLRHGVGSDTAPDAERALKWHPCRLYLLRALLDRRGEALPVLEALVTTGRLPIDDQLGALLLLNHPDHGHAARMLTPFMKQLGEATTLAIAQREHARGHHAGALHQIDGMRPLSRFRDQALAIACRCHLAQGKVHLVSEYANQLIDPGLRKQWERFLPEEADHPA